MRRRERRRDSIESIETERGVENRSRLNRKRKAKKSLKEKVFCHGESRGQ